MKAEVRHAPNMAVAARAFNQPAEICDLSAQNRQFSGLSGHIVATLVGTRTTAIDEARANA